MKGRAWAFLATLLYLMAGGQALAAQASPGQWLLASDIHLDPYAANKHLALYGSDTNLALFAATLRAMKASVPNPRVVVLPGDFLVHGFDAKAHGRALSPDPAGTQTMRSIAAAFDRTFPKAQFVIALGNNDAPCGDYRSDLDGAYLKMVAAAWAPLVNRKGAAPDFERSFAATGNYTSAVASSRVRLVVLNTIPFSLRYRGDCGPTRGNFAADELSWLQSTLSSTPKSERNVVVMHIPPGFDAFSTQALHGYVAVPFLGSGGDRLASILNDNAAGIGFAISGHTHRYDVRMVGKVPTVLFGAISPVYHNNPAFYVLRVDDAGRLLDVQAHAYDEWTNVWLPPHSFDKDWHAPAITAESLTGIHDRLGGDARARAAWDRQSMGWPTDATIAWPSWGATWKIPWCAQTELGDGFVSCAGIERRVTATRAAVVALAVLLAGAIAALVWLFYRKTRPSTAALRASAQDDK